MNKIGSTPMVISIKAIEQYINITKLFRRGKLLLDKFLNLEAHIKELEENLLQSDIRLSTIALNELLCNDFLEFTSSGKVKNKEDCLNGLQTLPMELYDFSIKQLSEELILSTYRLNYVDRNQHSLRSSIWKNSQARWQMLFHQGTPTEALTYHNNKEV